MFTKVWLHYFLQRIAKKFPNLFNEILDSLDITEKQKLIMRYRYIEEKKFKQIGDLKGVCLCQRQVEKLHHEVVDKIKNI